MEFINKRTRAVIDSPTMISGGDWVLKGEEEPSQKVIVPNKEVVVEAPVADEMESINTFGMDDLTKADIMQELDAFGIKYDKRQTKAELYALMMNGK